MKAKFIFLLLPFVVFSSIILLNCSSDPYYDESETVIVRDTLVIPVDTLIGFKKEMQKTNFNFTIQLGAFENKNYADNFADKVKESLNAAPDVRKSRGLYIITFGDFSDASKANDFLKTLRSKGFDKAFILKLN
ncbi:SPOR domain-containing protein [bacterium]|nr:MAG: SPOR domain-containing protein [bacterium]